MKTKPFVLLASLLASPVLADEAPRGSSYKEPVADAPAPVETLVSQDHAADLRVKRMPAKLKMRPKQKAVAQAGTTAGSSSDAGPADTSTSVGYKMFPTTRRDLRERVAFRIRAGVALDGAPAVDNETQRGGLPLPDDFSNNRNWLMGDAIVGARGIITPSLNGYFLSSFAFDVSDAIATRAATVSPYDNQELVIKAGYAEWGYDDRKPDDSQKYSVWLRGGRQFRLDGGNLFAYFDGATLGYRTESVQASVFGGQRVALFVDTEPGIVFGATAAMKLKGAKTKIALDYMGLSISSTDYNVDGEIDGETRHLVVLSSRTELSKKMKLDLRARLTGLPNLEDFDPTMDATPATKFALGRVGGRLRYETDRMVIIGDAEQRFGDDIAYDLAAPSSVDIVQVANRLGVGLNTPIDATSLGFRADWLNAKKTGEVLVFARTEIPSETPTTVDQRAFVEGGFGVAGSPVGVRGSGVYTTAQYTFRQFTNEGKDGDNRIDGVCNDLTDGDMDGIPDNCVEFGNGAGSGVDAMHQLAAEAVLASRGKDGKRWRASAGAFFRVFNFSSPYREVTNDSRGGGRLDLQWWFSRDLHLDIAGEVAQASPTLAREIGLMTALRAALEARW